MQYKRVLTFTDEEAQIIRGAYAQYILAGGEVNMNTWMKDMIMEKVKQ